MLLPLNSLCRSARLGLAVFVLLLLAVPAAAQVVWDGGGDGTSWSDAANWNPDGVPSSTDPVVIDQPGTYTVQFDGSGMDQSYAVRSLTLGCSGPDCTGTQTLLGSGYTVDLGLIKTSTIRPTGRLEWTSSNDDIKVSDTLAVAGVFEWKEGNLFGAGVLHVAPAGTLRVNAPGESLDLDLPVIDNEGTIEWLAGGFGSSSDTDRELLYNRAGALFKIALGEAVDFAPGTSSGVGYAYRTAIDSIQNAGTIRMTAAGAAELRSNLRNEGLVQVDGDGRLEIALSSSGRSLTGRGGTFRASAASDSLVFRLDSDSTLVDLDAASRLEGNGLTYMDGTEGQIYRTSRSASAATAIGATVDLPGTLHVFGNRYFHLNGVNEAIGRLVIESQGGDEEPKVFLPAVAAAPLVMDEIDLTGNGLNVTLTTDADLKPAILRMRGSSPVLDGTGDVTVTSQLDWHRGDFRGTGRVVVGGTGLLRYNGTKRTFREVVFAKGSTVDWTDGDIDVGRPNFSTDPGFIVNRGTMTLAADAADGNDLLGYGHLKNRGTIVKPAGVDVLFNTRVFSHDTLRVAEGTLKVGGSYDARLSNESAGTLRGTGIIDAANASFLNLGTIHPGLPSAPTGTLSIEGNTGDDDPEVRLLGGQLAVDVAGPTDYNRLSINDRIGETMSMAARLQGRSYTPAQGDTYDVLAYANPDYPGAPAGFYDLDAPLSLDVEQDATNTGVSLTVLGGSPTLAQGSATVLTHPDVAHLGHAVAMGDFDGNGRDDLAVTGLKTGVDTEGYDSRPYPTAAPDLRVDTVFVILDAGRLRDASVETPTDLRTVADLRVASTPAATPSVQLGGGNGLLHAADYDGDGRDDLFAGRSDGVAVFNGTQLAPGAGVVSASDAALLLDAATLVAAGSVGAYPDRVVTGDVDNDGVLDVAAGLAGASTTGSLTENGMVAVFHGVDQDGTAFFGAGASDGAYVGTRSYEHVGRWLDGGDANGDGAADLSIVAGGHLDASGIDASLSPGEWCEQATDYYDALIGQSDPGQAYLLYGPLSGSGDVATAANATINGEFPAATDFVYGRYAPLGRTLLTDLDGDGADEWHLSETIPRTAWYFALEANYNSNCAQTGHSIVTTGWFARATSRRFRFDPAELSPGTTRPESDGISDTRGEIGAGRALNVANTLGADDPSHAPALLQASDEGTVAFSTTEYSLRLGDTRDVDGSMFELLADEVSGFGHSLAVGRLEADALDDLAVGAPYLPSRSGTGTGALYVLRTGERLADQVVSLDPNALSTIDLPDLDLGVDFSQLDADADLSIRYDPDVSTGNLNLPGTEELAREGIWQLDLSGTPSFTAEACFALDRLTVPRDDIDFGALQIAKRETEQDPWTYPTTELRPSVSAPTEICATGLTSFSQFAVTAEPTALPVELAAFDARLDEDRVHLAWTTTTETNNAGFEVQRRVGSGSDAAWTRIGSVDGAGTTDEARSYQFTDAALPFATEQAEYRLRQVDLDGTASLSSVVTVTLKAPAQLALHPPFPNPVRGIATVRYTLPESVDAGATLRLYDVMGRAVRTLPVPSEAGRHQRPMDVSTLASGTYVLRLTAGGTTKTRRLTVVR